MFEIDKETLGAFIASLRKEKGYTQKELATRLFISDKAVSKWERGLSCPDIALLIPLADILGVTVTELLEGRKLDASSEMEAGHVETLVKTALTLLDEHPEKKKQERQKNALTFGTFVLMGLLELLTGYFLGKITAHAEQLLVLEALSFIFGIYFWLFIRQRLPGYYDENRISAYSDGVFRFNIPGISFNNSNWPHIVKAGRIWSAVTLITVPPAVMMLPEDMTGSIVSNVIPCLYLAGLFVPMYAAGKKYQ